MNRRGCEQGAVYFQTAEMLEAIPLEGEWVRPREFGRLKGNTALECGVEVAVDMVRFLISIDEGRQIVSDMCNGETFRLNPLAVERWAYYYKYVLPILGIDGKDRKEKGLTVLARARNGWLGLLSRDERKELDLDEGELEVTREDIRWAREVARAFV
jgi:hypothetical protein